MVRIRCRDVVRLLSPGMVLVLGLVFATLPQPARADKAINTTFLSGVAVKGYDAVAYFTKGRAVAGSSDHEYQWMDATWRFSSAANRSAFAADPERFAPQYGGYCAWAVSQGYTADIDPEAWKIVNGKLYLNYSKSVQARWQQNVPANIAKADANWPNIQAELSH